MILPNRRIVMPHRTQRLATPLAAAHSSATHERLLHGFADPRMIAFAVGVVLIGAIWMSTLMLSSAHRRNVEMQASGATRELVQTYEAHTLRALREIETALRTLVYAYELVGPAQALEQLRNHGLLPPELLFEVSIADPHGRVVSSTRHGGALHVGSEDFFAGASERTELFISAPKRGDGETDRKLVFSQRLENADGEFAGIAFISVDAAFFVSSYDPAYLGKQGLLALVGTDGIVRASRLGDTFASGATVDPSWLEPDADDRGFSGALAQESPDGISRYVSARVLSSFPMAVIVGLARDEQLAPAHERARDQLLIAAGLTIIVGWVVFMLGRSSWILIKMRAREQRTRLTAAREAGMAEIATNVLHNVGNALNSVNVSASLVAQTLRQTKIAGLTRAIALMREHQCKLGEFVNHDAQGKQLLPYLEHLDAALQADERACISHLDSLEQSVEHIKKIVALQQMLAKPCAVREEVDLVGLMELGVQMNGDSLERHAVKVIRDFDTTPALSLDKHAVLQILLNLINNARQSCCESARADKLLSLGIRRQPQCIELSVADNGVGISAENLTRIFQYGFTTRPHGHGFGLHSSALAARELGGRLTAHSDGPDFGAVFTLTLPTAPASP